MKYTTSESVLRKELGSVWYEIWRRLSTCTKSSESRQTLPGGDHSLPDGQAPGPAVLLWLSGQVPVNPDWHRQPLLRAVAWFGGRGGESRDAGRVPSKQKRMAHVGQMEWAKTGAVQAGVRGHSRNCSVQQVLFHGGWEWKRRNCPQKGTLKPQNNLNWDQYKDAVEGRLDTATNRGMRMNGGVMCTYEKKKLELRAYYDKWWVLPNGIHMEQIEYHL